MCLGAMVGVGVGVRLETDARRVFGDPGISPSAVASGDVVMGTKDVPLRLTMCVKSSLVPS